MKVIFEIPDGTLGAFLSLVWHDGTVMKMGTQNAGREDLFSGKTLVFEPEMKNGGKSQ